MKSCRELVALVALFLALFAIEVQAKVEADVTAVVDEVEALALGTDAYVYAYPLVTMEYTRRIMTNVAAPEGTRAPMGQFVRARSYPDASFTDVTAPNDRFFLFPMLDGWTNVFQDPGKRTTGTAAQKYAITGPGWSGTLPAGVTEYKSPTAMVWILGRIYCNGTPEDYKAVHALQDQLGPIGDVATPSLTITSRSNSYLDVR